MITLLLALQVIQAPPSVDTSRIAVKPGVVATPRATRDESKLAQARALIARAEAVRANYIPAAGQPSRAELDASVEQLKQNLDSMSDMSTTESVRLQMAMDRLSKMMTTLSNVLKKISETSDTITQNIK